MPNTVICHYRVVPGNEARFESLLEDHWPTLHRLGLVTDDPPQHFKGAEQDNIYITVSRKGEYYFEGSRVSLQQLNDSLAMRQTEKDRVVAITADKNLNYSVINELIELLRDQDFLNVLFMSQPRREKVRIYNAEKH